MMPEADFVSAILPLLQSNSVEVLEWSFDTFMRQKNRSGWMNCLIFIQKISG